jgi:hypothetical protein
MKTTSRKFQHGRRSEALPESSTTMPASKFNVNKTREYVIEKVAESRARE